MKRFEIVDSFGDTIEVEAELGLYAAYDFMDNKMPNICIQLYCFEEGFREPYATLTVNFGEFIGAKNCAYIDTNNNYFTAQLLEMGFCTDTGFTKQSGFCTYPLWHFNEEFLKSIDTEGLYEVYSGKFDDYMNDGPQLPVYDREGEVVTDVMAKLGLEGVNIDFDSDGMTVRVNDSVYSNADVYRYLLGEVCEYDSNGVVKGLDLELCVDFYDLCVHNGVDFHDYNKPKEFEYVITMSSGGGTVCRFTTCDSREEAEKLCESYGWQFKDENDFVWELDIEKQEKSLENKLADAGERSDKTDICHSNKDDYTKE